MRRAEDAARRTAGYFDQRLQGGMIGYLDVVESQRTLLQAERGSVQNLGARYSASVQLIKSLGGGWQATGPAPQHDPKGELAAKE